MRETLARLRASTLTVVACVTGALALSACAAAVTWQAGQHGVIGVRATALLALLAAAMLGCGWMLLLAVRRSGALARRHATDLTQAVRTLEASTLETFAALNATVEAKDRYTAGHGLRVTLISMLIGQEMGLPAGELDLLRHAATFHDIGKIAVPDAVLLKPGRLTDAEFEAMKTHPVESARICGKLASLREAVPTIRAHHERMDGFGYPDGLRGREIPIGARIIAVADTWDAITSDRPYRRGQPAPVALDEIRRCIGSQFDPHVVDAFVEVLAKDPWMFGLSPRDLEVDPAAPGRLPRPAAMGVPPLHDLTVAALAGEGLGYGAADALRPRVTHVSGNRDVTGAGRETELPFDSWFDEGDLAA